MKNNDRNSYDKYLKLSELGSDYNLSFSSHLTLGSRIIALDGIKKKLLIAEIKDKVCRSFLIKLDEIRAISIKKIYSNIKVGELTKKRLVDFLKGIYLQFDYDNGEKATVLPFYESEKDKVDDPSRLEKTARNWYILLTKIADTRNRRDVKEKAQLKIAG